MHECPVAEPGEPISGFRGKLSPIQVLLNDWPSAGTPASFPLYQAFVETEPLTRSGHLVQHYNFADSSLPALNLATFLALILITAPV